MSARINIVTLGVSDIASATAFYEKLGFEKSKSMSNPDVTFFKGAGVVLGLFGKEPLIEDGCLQDHWTGQGGISLAQNLESEVAVDEFIALAEKSGAKILKPAAKTFWGGYSCYYADPDGHVWEIAHNPFFPISDKGLLELSD
jgi:hypothetical protein